MSKSLTAKQEQFCKEYIKKKCITKSAIKAGYAKSSAHVTGTRLLKNAKIQAYIKKITARREKRTEVNQDKIIHELSKIAFSDIMDFIELRGGFVRIKKLDEMPKNKTGVIKRIKEKVGDVFEFGLYDKIRALEILLKHVNVKEDLNLNETLRDYIETIGLRDTNG